MGETNNENIIREEPELSEVLQVRREKLQELQQGGRDPFQIVRYDVDHHSPGSKRSFFRAGGEICISCGPHDVQADYGEGFFLSYPRCGG